MNTPQLLVAGLVALAPLATLAQTRTSTPAPPPAAKGTAKPAAVPATGFDVFTNVPHRNIFNSRRFAGRTTEAPPPAPARRDPVIETFSLLGTLDYPKGSVAFFEGSSASHRKAVAVGETISDCTITSVEANLVRLAAGSQPLELKVGYMLRREDQGEWQMREAERPSDYGSSSTSGFGSPFGSSSPLSFNSSSSSRDPRYSSSSGSSRDSRSGRDSRSSSSFSSNETPAESAQRRIRDQDRNGDGKISRDEADSRLRPNFELMDRNRDGIVDSEEYTAYYASRMSGSSGSSVPPTSSFNSPSGSASPGSFGGSPSPGSASPPPASAPSAPGPGGSGESDLLKRLMEQRARENR